MTGPCRLCNRERELKDSHIVPEFMYQNIYDQNPRRFYTLKINLDDEANSSKLIEQKGIREHLLCGECESLLSKYEKYAAETIYAKNKGNKTFIKKASETDDEKYFLYEYAEFSYEDFKQFLISILWRVCVSKTYGVEMDNESLEKMRFSLYEKKPLKADEFGCLVQILFYKKGERAGGFILEPFYTKNGDRKLINILVDGLMFSFYFNSEKLPTDTKKHFLQTSGEMDIIGRVIFEDKGLSSIVKKGYEYFNKVVKPNGK